MGTNSGAPTLPFQKWRHFKEAYTPELVARAIEQNPVAVKKCLDPFGGSGTTAIACQFLGVKPLTIEVNPYLADLIHVKLTSYNTDALARDLGRVLRWARKDRYKQSLGMPVGAPSTLVEPGVAGKWVFDRLVAQMLAALLRAIERVTDEEHRRLFKVLLGGILLEVSNVVVNGKGRRYRRCWKDNPRDPRNVNRFFGQAVRHAISDIHRFRDRAMLEFHVVRGDARMQIHGLPQCDLAVFSPPYPNSFDYTDVYNLELWILGYLDGRSANRSLRESTLCSHVQIARRFPDAPCTSPLLCKTLERLDHSTDQLWNPHIPKMIGSYFADLLQVLSGLHVTLNPRGTAWIVVGDSRYASVHIPTAAILAEIAASAGFYVLSVEPFRSMRSSVQQGGRHELEETLLVLNPVTP